jgi:biotin operon repressor
VSIDRTAAALGISRSTVWRRIKDGTLLQAGTGKIIKKSTERFAQPINGTA